MFRMASCIICCMVYHNFLLAGGPLALAADVFITLWGEIKCNNYRSIHSYSARVSDLLSDSLRVGSEFWSFTAQPSNVWTSSSCVRGDAHYIPIYILSEQQRERKRRVQGNPKAGALIYSAFLPLLIENFPNAREFLICLESVLSG